MSRGPSPAPLTAQHSLPSTSTSSYEPPSRPPRPPRAPLRVETGSLHPSTSALRARSNSAQSHSPFAQVSSHQFSRSLSHNVVALSPTSPVGGRNDVAMAVNGLRGAMSASRGGEMDEILSPVSDRSGRVLRITTEDGSEDMILRRIQEALEKSPDEGNTLDLSRRGIEQIGADAVDMFRNGVGKDMKGVWRLALSYNALCDGSIVDSFARLSRLRYLNLKGNAFTEFPAALSALQSLEILDLSKNKIEAFPENPGRLAHLKVLSLTNNRIYALPSYLTSFSHLKVFKVDQNPIEWPPKEVLGSLIDNAESRDRDRSKSKKDEDLRPWIENMKSWMRQKTADGDRLMAQQKDEEASPASEEEPVSAISTDAGGSDRPRWGNGSSASLVAPSSQKTVRPLRDDPPRAASPINPKFSLGTRNRAATMSEDSLPPRSASPGLAPPNRPFVQHDRSRSNSSYTPPHSASTAASTASSSSHSRNVSSVNLPASAVTNTGHSRGASYTATQRLSGSLSAKKSLPDLRLSHAKIMQDRRNGGLTVEATRPLGLGITSPQAHRYPSASLWSESSKPPAPDFSHKPRLLPRKGSADMLRTLQTQIGESSAKRDSGEGPMADESRNSYFRRLSTLPKSTISKTIPPALLKFMDAIRGILFALSQLHSALRQYLTFAVDDRVAGVFNRIMEPASGHMNNLINALDRFDSTSRRSMPPLSAIKGVIDATRQSVALFTKVVAVLRLQCPALRHGDVRYTRTLLLMIYGSMAEVGYSWNAMEPLLMDIKPLLATATYMGGLSMAATGSMPGRTPISPIPERGESRSPSSAHRSSITTINGSPAHVTAGVMAAVPETKEAITETPAPARSGRNRRQGGSFSTEDVERGMMMGSPVASMSEGIEDGPASYMRHRPSASAQIVLEDQAEESDGEEETLMPLPEPPFAKSSRSGSMSGVPVTPPELTQNPQPVTMVPSNNPRIGRGHHASSSAGSLSAAPMPLRKLSVDVRPPTPASAVAFDEDLLDVIEHATEIAFIVWLKLAEDIHASSASDSPIHGISHHKSGSQSSMASSIALSHSDRPASIPAKYHSELVILLSRAEQITTTLRETLAGIRANSATWNHSTLPDDAQAFIKTVVKVSELVKIISATHLFPQGVRQSCSKLTQATRECAILIQVSSLRPGASTPAPIPPTSARPLSPNYRSGTAESSAEDLTVPPHSAGWMGPPSAASIGSFSGTGPSGLRGLQLPSRHAARRRDERSRDPPRSAQPGQTSF